MPEIEITKKVRWECQRCGKCCKGIIMSKKKNLSILKDGKHVCKSLTDKLCSMYNNRPFICKIYPFIMDITKCVDDNGVARPQKSFLVENLKIHTECSGYGKGKRVYANKKVQKELKDLGYGFALRFKDAFDKKIDLNEVI